MLFALTWDVWYRGVRQKRSLCELSEPATTFAVYHDTVDQYHVWYSYLLMIQFLYIRMFIFIFTAAHAMDPSTAEKV